MNIIIKLFVIMFVVSLFGCQTVHDTAKTGGEYIGKGADAVGGVTEGATEGYVGETPSEENPFER